MKGVNISLKDGRLFLTPEQGTSDQEMMVLLEVAKLQLANQMYLKENFRNE